MKKSSGEIASEVLLTKISYIESDLKEVKDMLASGYVTKQEFDPVKKIVYGVVSLILIGAIGAILALVYR